MKQGGLGQCPTVVIASSKDEELGDLRAPLDAELNYEQIDAIVRRALDMDPRPRHHGPQRKRRGERPRRVFRCHATPGGGRDAALQRTLPQEYPREHPGWHHCARARHEDPAR